MTIANVAVRIERQGPIGVIVIDNPPVNAISPEVRVGITAALEALRHDENVRAVVLHCAGGTFIAGADIRRLAGAPPGPPSSSIVEQIEDMPKPVIAALQGNALGGGLEFAMGCHWRCAAPGTRLGLPEVNLGLIPGAGGTQRLPRLAGIEATLSMVCGGNPIGAGQALELGLVDRIIPGEDVLAEAVAYAEEILRTGAGTRRTRDLPVRAFAPGAFEEAQRVAGRNRRGEIAPLKAIEAVQAATDRPYAEGLRIEHEIFVACRESAQSRALRHLFMAERQVGKVPGIDRVTPVRSIARTGVVGGGTMGRGIAMAFAASGLPTILVETSADAAERALLAVRDSYAGSVAKGRLGTAEAEAILARIEATHELDRVADVDLVVEAVFEDMQVKQELFRALGAITRPDCVLATNTSALDVDQIAAASGRAADAIGLHFFSPAQVMRLLEIVRGRETSTEVIATSMALARRLGKFGVLAGNCDGFIGNRMLAGYRREAEFLLLEGASPQQVDKALVAFGMSMGPNAMGDMAGLDIGAAGRRRRRLQGTIPDDPRYGAVADRLVAEGRYGQKTGGGYYRYEPGTRKPLPDPAVEALIEAESARLRVPRRKVTDEEIVDRCMLPLINEAARIIEEGNALRAGDVDVVWVHGYGFPRYRGGPMRYADELGLPFVLAAIERFRSEFGALYWEPAPLLTRLADEGRGFDSLH